MAEEKRRIEEELRELSDGVEMATLDKEMAEERVRTYKWISRVKLMSLHVATIQCKYSKIVIL